eukprot:gene4567-6440_t
MISEINLTDEDEIWINKFKVETEHRINSFGIHCDLNIFSISEHIGLDMNSLNKEVSLMYGLWIALLSIYKKYYPSHELKYPTLDTFLNAYEGKFDHEIEQEKNHLWQTANWMSILFKMITARKNKGLAMQVVPKVIEGMTAKYVTGSGQTRATANRVHIFEVEGGTKANHRGKIKGSVKSVVKKQISNVESSIKSDDIYSNLMTGNEFKMKKRKRGLMNPPVAGYSDVINGNKKPFGTRSKPNVHQNEDKIENHDTSKINKSTASESESFLNEEIRKAYALLRQVSNMSTVSFTNESSSGGGASDGFDFMIPSRNRYISNDPLNFIELPPSDLQRGFSWTEIPVAPLSLSAQNSTSYDALMNAVSLELDNVNNNSINNISNMNSNFNSNLISSNNSHEQEPVGSTLSQQALVDIFSGYS